MSKGYKHPDIGLYVTGEPDVHVYKEQSRCYRQMIARCDKAKVLDFGGHCGFFNNYVHTQTQPKQVISIEPDPLTFKALEKNAGPKSKVMHGAVMPNKGKATLYRSATYCSKNSTMPIRGREQVEVPAFAFRSLLRGVNVIKCDCEGGEYDLDWHDLPDSVHTIVIEYHFSRPDWTIERIQDVLLEQGFTILREPKYNTFSKVGIGAYTR